MNPDLGFLQLEIRVGYVCEREKQSDRKTERERERGNSQWILNVECHLKSQEHDNKYIACRLQFYFHSYS